MSFIFEANTFLWVHTCVHSTMRLCVMERLKDAKNVQDGAIGDIKELS